MTYVTAVAIGYTYSSSSSSTSSGHVHIDDKTRHQTYAKNASSYDNEIGTDEFFMGLNLLRWWHLRQAKGNLLEIGCGTGRNFSYYGQQVSAIRAVDSVPDMIAQAAKKLSAADKQRVTLQVMNAHALAFPDESFDTVVDTFGLCSYEDPVAVLREMARVCRPGGRLLLIEHGQGSFEWINRVIDGGAQRHADHWGCVWNRDILALLRRAQEEEEGLLEVVSVSRWHFGTTYVIEARRRPRPARSQHFD